MSSTEIPLNEEIPAGLWTQQLQPHEKPVSWLWQGYLAPGYVTLLTSQWKSGKTTLISILLNRLKEGGILAGLPVSPGRAVVVSEEGVEFWAQRQAHLGFGEAYFFCRPFRGKPTMNQWLALIDRVGTLQRHHGMNLLVLDTLATFLPGHGEAQATLMLEALLPLYDLTRQGMSVMLLHHPRKGEIRPGQAARGTGALPAFADIIVEMDWCGHGPDDRRRRLLAFSRHEQTPRQLVIELNLEGTDYRVKDFQEDDFMQNWDRLKMVLEDATAKRTRQQIREEWPADYDCPHETTLLRWLQRAVNLGLVRQHGTGRRNDPFLYWLPEKEEKWKDPQYEFNRQMEDDQRKLMEFLDLPARDWLKSDQEEGDAKKAG